MSTKALGLLAIGATFYFSAATAQAQSAATCSFDAPSATLTVTLDGMQGALTRTAAGQIRLNNVACTGATTSTTDFIQVDGGALNDTLVVTGSFAPGATVEVNLSEIEWGFALGAGSDTVKVNYTTGPDDILFTSGGIDVGSDGDQDMTTAGVDVVRVYGKDADDVIDATLYTGGGKLYLYGGNGVDTLYGSAATDWLYGDADADTLYGAAGNDIMYGGAGDDTYYGEAGNDKFFQEATVDGNDTFFGGDGKDTLDYGRRSAGVTVTLGNGAADDGQAGAETDFTDVDVESATGGTGADVLVGNGLGNTLKGNDGDDELYGAAGNDVLYGGEGGDLLVGDLGSDTLRGEGGPDSLDGGVGNDKLYGGLNNDTLDGGTGTDMFFGEAGDDTFFNADGIAETVDCGPGTADDPELDGGDTYLACELI